MARLSRKEMKTDEVMEAAYGAGQWLEENWKPVSMWLGGVLAVVLLVLGWNWIANARKAEARTLLAQAQSDFTAWESGESVDADGLAARFEEAADLAGGAPTGLVARYYQALTLERTGNPAGAVDVLDGVVSRAVEPVLRDSARLALARSSAAVGDLARADEVLRGLAADGSSVVPAEQALLILGELYARAGERDRADAILQEIVETYPGSRAATAASTRLEAR